MSIISFNNKNIKIKDNKYNLKDIFNVLNYTNYENFTNTNNDVYYSKEELLVFLTKTNEYQLKNFILNNHFENKLLNIFEFLENNDYSLNSWFVNFWVPLFNQEKIVLTNKIINLITDTKIKLTNNAIYKKNILIKKYLIKNNIPYKILKYKDLKTYEYKYYEHLIRDDISQYSSSYIHKKIWISMLVKDFKLLILVMNSKFAEEVREYYINHEIIMINYFNYIKNNSQT